MAQKMAELPKERMIRTPPFYHCGLDVFGPFKIRHGKTTRTNPGVQKVWVLIFSCLYSRAIHLESLDSMDTASFKLAFNRFQAIRGDCQYLRSDAGSNFMGARNEKPEDEPIVPDSVINEVRNNWELEGRLWDVNPPLASHFGGVWELAIGQVRPIIGGYLLPKQDRVLTREEFQTLLLHATRIVNSTPLHDAAESPNAPQPISPHHLIAQRDDACKETYSRPTNYNQNDLLAYGRNRWRRIEALADAFDHYWKHYLYQIGTDREKWTAPQTNAQVGDIVLLKEKNTHRLDWPTGVITSVTKDQDNLVRRVLVQPHKRQGQTKTPQIKERAIHDLVLIKSFTYQDNANPDSTTNRNAPAEAKSFLCSVYAEDRELLCDDPIETPPLSRITRPKQMTQPLSENEISTLQTTVDDILNKIDTIRKTTKQPTLNPEATPFTPNIDITNEPTEQVPIPKTTITTTAQVHSYPKLKWEEFYSHSYVDQGQLKHALKPDRIHSKNQTDLNTIMTSPVEPDQDMPSPNNVHLASSKDQERSERHIHWNPDIRTHYIKPSGIKFQFVEFKPPFVMPTTKTMDLTHQRKLEERFKQTGKSKKERDQFINAAITTHLCYAKNANIDPRCPPPKYHKKHTNLLTQPTVMQRPKEDNEQPGRSNHGQNDLPFKNPPRSLEERQEIYEKARAWIFGYGSGFLTEYYPPLHSDLTTHPSKTHPP